MAASHALTPEDLYGLEQYAKLRPEFRARVLEHKQSRRLHVGAHLTLVFEDRLTIQYQIQEMLRAERIFEESGIREELEAYNPLIPDGANWKATLLIEYTDVEERRQALQTLVGIESAIWLQVVGHAPIFPIADEDLSRSLPEKTSAVHFLRYELPAAAIHSLRQGASLRAGVSASPYGAMQVEAPELVRESLLADLD